MSDIDHEYTDEITCPGCGYEFGDSWQWKDNDQDECQECGCEFSIFRHVEITYSTEKIEPKKQ